MTVTRDKLLELAKEAGEVRTDERGRIEVEFDDHGLERFAALLSEGQEGEPVAPHIIEALSYHARERDDLTLDEALDYLRHGWKKVCGRTERELVLQITALLAGASVPPSSDQVWNETVEKCREAAGYTGLEPRTDIERAYMQGREDAADDVSSLKRPSQAQEHGAGRNTVNHPETRMDAEHSPLVESASGAVGEPITWRCFHCNEYFTDEVEARLHFGRSERQSPACSIDIAEYRAMESRMEAYNDEDADIHRQMARMQIDHAQALRREEEKGYAKGLSDTLSQQSAQVTDDLDFIPDDQHTIADMANVGYSLMQTIKAHQPDYCWNESPAEIVGNLSEKLDELSRVQAAPDWKPIETAPKDGSLMLLAVEFDRPGDWRIKIGGYWHESWNVFGGSWIPTMWAPMPAAPSTQPQRGGN